MLTEDMLRQYRAEQGCMGAASHRVAQTLMAEDAAAVGERFGRVPEWINSGRVAALDYDRAARAAAEKGCWASARDWWIELIKTFPEDDFAEIRQLAQAALDRANAGQSTSVADRRQETPTR